MKKIFSALFILVFSLTVALTFSVKAEEPTVEDPYFKDTKEIVNGDFADETDTIDNNTGEGWKYWSSKGAAGDFFGVSYVDGQMVVELKQAITGATNLQLLQSKIKLEKGKTYQFIFSAKSTVERDILVLFKTPWTAATGETVYESTKKTFSLTTSMQKFVHEFTVTEDTHESLNLSFGLGSDKVSTVTIDDVKLTVEPIDNYSWFDDYEEDGKTVLYQVNKRESYTDGSDFAYSGFDVIIGDLVFPISKANPITFASEFEKHVYTRAKKLMLYVNDTEEPWNLEYHASNWAHYVAVVVNGNGQVTNIDNTIISFNEYYGAEKGIYDVYWDFTEETAKTAKGGGFAPDWTPAHIAEEGVKHLTYGDLGTNYPWLTKEKVDANKVDGITFNDADKLYITSAKKYTNVAEGNTPVNNDEKGSVVEPGGFVLFIGDEHNQKHAAALADLPKYVDGQEGVATWVENDATAPTIEGGLLSTPKIDVKPGDVLEGIETDLKATDEGLTTVDDDTTEPEVSVEYYSFNFDKNEYEKIDNLEFSFPGEKYQIRYIAIDANGNKAVKTVDINVIIAYSPIINGPKDLTINQGQAIDLLAGVTVDDGYGHEFKENLVVIKGNFDPKNPAPGKYTITYLATNAYLATTTKTIQITVNDTEKPTVIYPTEKVYVKQGAEFDLLSVVYAFDNGGQVYKTIVKDNWFDTDKLGVYNIQVSVADKAQNTVMVNFVVEVVEETFADNLTRIEELEKNLNDSNTQLETENSQLKTALEELQAKLVELKNTSESKAKNATIFTIIVAAIAAGGVGTAVVSLLKKFE